ncbi:MAG: multiheme c-type cytochrome [Planctomycetota bacterium]|nr:multiheme c-type cytochrome [Planctomycetota bacterium]MDA1178476.1 multiheme c-type cytochrome [Planctomycetota bacterium]
MKRGICCLIAIVVLGYTLSRSQRSAAPYSNLLAPPPPKATDSSRPPVDRLALSPQQIVQALNDQSLGTPLEMPVCILKFAAGQPDGQTAAGKPAIATPPNSKLRRLPSLPQPSLPQPSLKQRDFSEPTADQPQYDVEIRQILLSNQRIAMGNVHEPDNPALDPPVGTDEDLLIDTPSHTERPIAPMAKSMDADAAPSTTGQASPKTGGGDSPAVKDQPKSDPHAELFARNPFPSAKDCRGCHEKTYEEWAISGHAYAYVSPMFQKFEQAITDLTQGTIGYFCIRCHSPVGATTCESRDAALWEVSPAAREGVTCIVCHRVKERYGRVNGERRIEPGDIFEPVYGAGHGDGLRAVISKKEEYKVKTSPEDKGPGQPIHREAIQFDQLSSSSFCASCHQVAVYPGIKLEVVWEQYRASPACKKGISCQDCHMGKIPGLASGYDIAPKAIVADKPISPDSKHSNHTFYGPGYSIAHPGIFPFHKDADRWSTQDWLRFDYRAGWGTEAFEEQIEDKKIVAAFPAVWKEVDDRMDAREIVDANLKKLRSKHELRRKVMENGSHLEGPFFAQSPATGKSLRFHYDVTNRNEGHNYPTASLGAQPQFWLNVVLTGPSGQRVWESGYVDANGDLADLHSLEVAAGRIPHDDQLFNLQTKFLTTNVKGTEREMCLPINVDIDQIPFIRPSGLPVTVLNHPPFIRMEAHSIAPLGTRRARYHIPAQCVAQPGRYRLSARMRGRAEPIYFMRFCRSTPEMERNMNEGILDYHEQAVEFLVR